MDERRLSVEGFGNTGASMMGAILAGVGSLLGSLSCEGSAWEGEEGLVPSTLLRAAANRPPFGRGRVPCRIGEAGPPPGSCFPGPSNGDL